MDHYHEVQSTLRPQVKELRGLIPDTWGAFARLYQSSMAEGELSTSTKELIAIASHARGAARHGASRQQVAEALGVTLLMDGGPASVYAPRALAAFDEFSR